MNVSLTPELEKLVNDKVASGMYHTASEVIREGLRLIRERDRLRELRLQELRREIEVGLEQSRRGQVVPAERVFRKLRKRMERSRRGRDESVRLHSSS